MTSDRGVTSMSGIWPARLQKSIQCVRLVNKLVFGNILLLEEFYANCNKARMVYVWVFSAGSLIRIMTVCAFFLFLVFFLSEIWLYGFSFFFFVIPE